MSYDDLSREELVEALKEMEKNFEDERREREKFEELAKKNRADLENYKKKQDERKQRWQDEAREDLAEDLIEVIDNLERALMAADEDSAVVKGVEMINEQLSDVLKRRGLAVIDTGERFDPEVHKAVDTVENDEHPPKTVLEEKRRGYRFNEKVLRPAEVVVTEKPDQDQSNE